MCTSAGVTAGSVLQAPELSHSAVARLTAYKKLGDKLEALEPQATTKVSLREPAPRALQAVDGDLCSGRPDMSAPLVMLMCVATRQLAAIADC